MAQAETLEITTIRGPHATGSRGLAARALEAIHQLLSQRLRPLVA
jgi:hypothetical protein